MTRNASHVLLVLIGASLALAGCSKTLTASTQDASLAPGQVAAKAEPAPTAEPAPAVKEPEPAVKEPAPQPKEEVRVAEPPMAEPAPTPAPPAPEAAAPAPAPEAAPVPEAPPAPQMAEQPAAAAPPSQLADLADVFFDYDKFSLRMEASPILDTNARLLKGENGWKLIIAGHCDERGTSAYNLVLGERRAQTVKKYLEDLGLPASQMQVTSYGKEKPFCSDHSQECWQQNRRAHFSLR